MTFELSAEQQAGRDRARAIARDRVAAVAAAIDRDGRVPENLMPALEAGDAVMLAVMVEEIAAESAGAAVAAALGPGRPTALSGLRGASLGKSEEPKARLVLAAAALGVARAALAPALRSLRDASGQTQGGEKPHWVLADAATEVDAARLLTLQAAQAMDAGDDASGEAAIAKLMAAAAAEHAVDAALRVIGPDGYTAGSLLERLSRDARAIKLLMGTEEEQRATAAAALYG